MDFSPVKFSSEDDFNTHKKRGQLIIRKPTSQRHRLWGSKPEVQGQMQKYPDKPDKMEG
jgi:hypothetical protein